VIEERASPWFSRSADIRRAHRSEVWRHVSRYALGSLPAVVEPEGAPSAAGAERRSFQSHRQVRLFLMQMMRTC